MVIIIMVTTLTGGIANFVTKQTILTSLGSQSQLAFYAASSGIECVLWWEIRATSTFSFATSTDSPTDAPVDDFCIGQDMSPVPSNFVASDWDVAADATNATTTIWLTAIPPISSAFSLDNPCVEIVVAKIGPFTEVLSTGYNTCRVGAARRVTRAVHIDY